MTALLRRLLLLTILMPGAAMAQAPDGWLDRFNQAMFTVNRTLGHGVEAVRDAMPDALTVPEPVRRGAANLLRNTINEPISALGHAITGRYDLAGESLRRFGINVVEGYGGVFDPATERGVVVPPVDLGLALCARGVPEGPYVVLPIVGPRTLRDAAADLVLTNLVIYAMLTPVIGPSPTLSTFLVIEVLDEGAALAMARQIDSVDESLLDPAALREAYLQARARRCDEVAARMPRFP